MKPKHILWLTVALGFILFPLNARAKETSKADYIDKVDTQLSDYQSKAEQLKKERDALPATSDRYKTLDKALGGLESSIKEAREEVSELKTSTEKDWEAAKKKIEKCMAALQKEYSKAEAR